MKKLLRLVLGLAILAVAVYLAILAYRKYAGPKDRVVFRTDTVRKGDLVRSITATGTVEPEEPLRLSCWAALPEERVAELLRLVPELPETLLPEELLPLERVV